MSFTFTEKDAGAGGADRVWYPRRVVLDRETGKARATVIDTDEFGEVFFLDGVIQSAEAEADKYHNLLVRPAMKMRERVGHLLGQPEAWNVLILGGGEGITAQKVLEWPQVDNLTQIDYDGELIRIFDQELPQWSRDIYNDYRLQIIIDDAWKALHNMTWAKSTRDAVIIDLTEPVEFGYEKWRELLDMCIAQLKPHGSIVLYAATLSNETGRPVLADADWGAWRVFVNALEDNEKTKHWKPFMYAIPMDCFGGYSLFYAAADAHEADWQGLQDPAIDFLWEEAKATGAYLMKT